MRIAKDLIVGLQYKLHMFGVPIHGLENVFCDNRGVVKNLDCSRVNIDEEIQCY